MTVLKEPLDIRHKELLYERFRSINTWISEYSFPNLYLFRKSHSYEVIFDREILISGITYDGVRHIMPTSDVRRYDPHSLKDLVMEYGVISPIPEEWLDAFPVDNYSYTFIDGDTDYVHKIDKLVAYSGKKLHKKKNLMNQFMDLYRSEALPLTNDRLGDARTILDEWQKNSADPPDQTDYYPCMEAIERYEELVLCGGIYYVEGGPAGFIIGEELNETVFALHFAKGIRKFKGLYQYMFNNFASVMPSKYCCFNFEQDLGKDSLRQAKATYEPEYMIKKYRVSLR